MCGRGWRLKISVTCPLITCILHKIICPLRFYEGLPGKYCQESTTITPCILLTYVAISQGAWERIAQVSFKDTSSTLCQNRTRSAKLSHLLHGSQRNAA